MNKNLKYILFIFLTTAFSYSCKTRKELKKASISQDHTAMLQADTVLQKVAKNHFKFKNFKAKITTKYRDAKGKKYTFTTLLKIKKDSIILANMTAFGIPVATIHITPDSIKFLNRRENTYFLGKFKYIEEKLNTKINFKEIQNLLTGNLMFLDTTKPHYLIDEISGFFISEIQKGLSPTSQKHPIKYWINELNKPGKTIFNNTSKNSKLTISNTEYKKVKDQLFPDKIEANFVSPKDTVNILLNYRKIKTEKNSTFKFKIPKNYTQQN